MFKKNASSNSFDLQVETIVSLAENSEIYENIRLAEQEEIPLMLAGSNGVYVFVAYEDKEKFIKKVKDIKIKYGLYQCTTFFFAISETECYLLDKDNKTLIELDDLYESFENIYENTQRPYMDYNYLGLEDYNNLLKSKEELESLVEDQEVEDTGDVSYVRPLVSKMILGKIDSINEKSQKGSMYLDKNTKVDEDGTTYVRKNEIVKYIGIIKGEKWFRCSDEDPDKIYWFTLLGGWFGLHKFKERKVFSGLFYLLTCGCFGVFYITDLLSMLTGSRSYEEISYEEKNNKLERYKEKIYYKNIENKKLALVVFPLAFVITYILLNTLYKGLYEVVASMLMSLSTMDIVTENVEERVKYLNELLN